MEKTYVDLICHTCQTVIAFTPAELVELRSNHGLTEDEDIVIANCPKCSDFVCKDCLHEGHA